MAHPPAGDGPSQADSADSADRFSLLFRALPLPLALLDEDGQVIDVNPALAELLDQSVVDLRGESMLGLTHPADRPRVRETVAEVAQGLRESVQMRKRLLVGGSDGARDGDGDSKGDGGDSNGTVPVRVTLLRLEEPNGAHHRLAQIEDLSVDDSDRLRREAQEDQLTGIGNRRALQQRLDPLLVAEGAATGAQAPGAGWSALFVDLDDFKHVNDALGHAVGDAVLVTVASRLSRLVRGGDLVCRVGGDEFVLILGTAVAADVRRAEARIRRSLAQPIAVGDIEVRISASVGSATPQAEDSAQALLARADAAMYRDKGTRPTS